MRAALLVIDVINDFAHPDGERLVANYTATEAALVGLLTFARERDIPVIYANDNHGVWDGDRDSLIERALAGPGGQTVSAVAPANGERFVTKPRYSAFDLTPLELILSSLETELIFLCGMTTEMCVTQTAIAARERGFKVTVVKDACAPLNEDNAGTALDYLSAVAGARVTDLATLNLEHVLPV